MSSNFTFKLVLLGDGRVWKTSLVLRYVKTYSPRSKKLQASFLFYKAPSHCAMEHLLGQSFSLHLPNLVQVDEVFLDIATRGTGINLTPPPATIISDEALQACNRRIENIANILELEGFSRIHAFVNVHNGEDLVIEVNTIPGMTPSTVLIHQALAEQPPIRPQEFFRTVLDLALRKSK